MWTNDTKIKKQRFLNMSRETAYVGKNNTACLGIKMIPYAGLNMQEGLITSEIRRTVTKKYRLLCKNGVRMIISVVLYVS